jgi:hypothetical protein
LGEASYLLEFLNFFRPPVTGLNSSIAIGKWRVKRIEETTASFFGFTKRGILSRDFRSYCDFAEHGPIKFVIERAQCL